MMSVSLFGLFAAGLLATTASPIPATPVKSLHPEMQQIVAKDAQLEILAEGFRWAEGPVAEPGSGDILFSDVPANKVWRYSEKNGVSLYLSPSGYTALDQQPNLKEGANGLIFNSKQQLILAQHGDRRLAILEKISGSDNQQQGKQPHYQTLISHFEQQQFNSPNDLVQHSDQSYFFTDPPYGLTGGDKSAQKQLKFNGVYRLDAQGKVQLISDMLSRPNGLVLSPDEKWLYVANSDPKAAQWWKFAVDGSSEPTLFFDATAAAKTQPGLPDGLKVLPSGHLLATGPGGVWVFSADGTHLGTIATGVAAANVGLSLDRKYLYITASSYLLRIRLQP
ncbi:SMP-30/gluconolactonase/LRE family protein [Rheinheimera riviphila]|uniref:SMP-30/gluconolactonase/LRE family protein n=1 Tax=Rheinheimera riviphila TaxID=1834037 RepID=A0A437QBQ4_9GAMM|nr:SMP-30/gluconolactonase/LRE family protein [Rheinheimera riviphila]RVU31988.1 SMP-30/gluconolactonase/LRE family protein [Rheinheimera riviphila]